MDQDLVDLSLFDDFPAASRHNTIQQRPAFQRLINEASQAGDYQGLHLGYPRSCTMKPLPPLPRKIVCAIRLDPRPGHGGSRCILSRIQRARLGGHAPPSTPSPNTLQQRRNTHPVPQLILSAPQPAPVPMVQPEEPSRPACPMIWLPDAQMWMMINDNDLVTYIPPEYYSPPPYQRQYARSEPSPNLRPQSEYSPVRTQFRTLIERRDEDERLSPLFQEAIHSVSMHEYDYANEPPTFQVERDWQSQYSTTRESWHTATSGVSAASTDISTNPRLLDCERWVMEIERPFSAR